VRAVAVGLHLATDVIARDGAAISHLVAEKAILNLFTACEASESKLIKRECAYAMSHFLRVLPRASQVPRLVPFVYQNLVEFELVETWAHTIKADGKADAKAALRALKAHCGQIGLKNLVPD
jgi:hypothetical protein